MNNMICITNEMLLEIFNLMISHPFILGAVSYIAGYILATMFIEFLRRRVFK